MRKTILILLSFLSVYHLYSQQDLLLKRFKYRVNDYREINFNVSGGGQLYNRELVSGNYHSNGSSGNLDVSYYKIKSTDKILLNISGNAASGLSSGRSKNPSGNDRSRSLLVYSQFSVLNKWFTKNLFIELGADLSANDRSNKYSYANPVASGKTKQNDYSIAIKLGIGKGRLENITDMQNALWLYHTLQEEKKLSPVIDQ